MAAAARLSSCCRFFSSRFGGKLPPAGPAAAGSDAQSTDDVWPGSFSFGTAEAEAVLSPLSAFLMRPTLGRTSASPAPPWPNQPDSRSMSA